MSRLHQGPMRDLLTELAGGELSPGDMLPREVDLTERFGVSRGVVRECIRSLEERSVVAVKHGRGATVTAREQWDVLDPEVLHALIAAPGGDELIDEALECQQLLEVQAAGLAAERAQHADLDALTHALERMIAEAPRADRTPTAAQRYHEADLDFHRAVVQASGNRALARMSAPLHRALITTTRERTDGADIQQRLSEHRKIAAAIASGDAEAGRSAMAEHLHASARRMRRPVTDD